MPHSAAASRAVPFDAKRHAGLGLSTAQGHRWCARRNAVPLSTSEFLRAALHYPIVYVRDADDRYVPMAVLGLRDSENLFVDDKGAWAPEHYVPAYVRRHPFSLADVNGAEAASRRLICVDETRLSAEARPALIDGDGRTTAAWEPIRQLLEAFDQDWQQTLDLGRRLHELGLLVPFDALAVPRHGDRTQLQGLYRIEEARLATLAADALRTLLGTGELRAFYAHLLSLENFGRLLDRMQMLESRHEH
ncbi:SapC family protein [Solimonas terrae]|uniref:SapC family protein n=1 Tax=Solimonas terrae TaxID=1396819 RepID=A0A6M2BQI9_9GAMM|nr:SapC family protein [Solimonas terrae]NGY04614.1 SapC family protein [Solimonas terrae]